MTDDDLTALRLVERADVYKRGLKATVLVRSSQGVRFSYLPSWIRDGGPPVASGLPLTSPPVLRPVGALPAYFAGLLPEGRRLRHYVDRSRPARMMSCPCCWPSALTPSGMSR